MFKQPPRLRVLLAQLPHPSYIDRNVPLAAGYLKASAYQHGLLDQVDIEILDPIFSDYSGCQMVVESIASKKPDIVGFSIYLWNAERTLYVIDKLKSLLPHLKVIVGGPEVTRYSNYIIFNSNIDISVFGEGEITFAEILNHFLTGNPKLEEISGICRLDGHKVSINAPRKRIDDLETIPSPYLLKYIDPKNYKELMIFTMRGCMLGCTYCSWAMRGKLRPYSIERLRNELILIKNSSRTSVVSIVDSAFNASPIFIEFCKMAREINRDNCLKFNCFVQADLVDERSAKLLRECNFKGVEVGLQSSNQQILANVNRSVDMKRFLDGIKCLEREGLQTKADIIIGLPGDSKATFEATIKFANDNKLDPLMFNLSLGHGAMLRRHADEFGAKAQGGPPFYVKETDTFPECDLKATIDCYREISADFDRMQDIHYPPIAYAGDSSISSYETKISDISTIKSINFPIMNIILDVDDFIQRSIDGDSLADTISNRIGSNLSLLIRGEDLGRSKGLIKSFLNKISKNNPYITWDILLETHDIVTQSFIEELISFIQKPKLFLDYRDEFFPMDLPYVRRRCINIFLLSSYTDRDIQVRESNLILKAVINEAKISQAQVQDLFSSKCSGFLIEVPNSMDMKSIMDIMGQLYDNNPSGRSVFFKDWVLQRLWEQEFMKITPGRQASHYELVVDKDLDLSCMFFDETALLWDAIIRRNMIRPEYSGLDMNDISQMAASKLAFQKGC